MVMQDDDDDEGASVAAIKSSVRHRLSEARGGRGGGVWGGAESADESSGEEGVERLIRAKRDEGDSRKRHLDPPEGGSVSFSIVGSFQFSYSSVTCKQEGFLGPNIILMCIYINYTLRHIRSNLCKHCSQNPNENNKLSRIYRENTVLY